MGAQFCDVYLHKLDQLPTVNVEEKSPRDPTGANREACGWWKAWLGGLNTPEHSVLLKED